MKHYTGDKGEILFRTHVGDGTFRGVEFSLDVTCLPDGTLLGMPIVTLAGHDGKITVVFDLEDIVPRAFDYVEALGSDGPVRRSESFDEKT